MVPLIRKLIIRKRCAVYNILFVYDEELKWSFHGYYFCLLANQLKVPTLVVRVKTCVRIYYVRTIVGTLVRFEVRLKRYDDLKLRRR